MIYIMEHSLLDKNKNAGSQNMFKYYQKHTVILPVISEIHLRTGPAEKA